MPKYDFSTDTIIATSVLLHFDVFFYWKTTFMLFFILIQGHCRKKGQGQKVNIKVKSVKNMTFHKYNYRYK